MLTVEQLFRRVHSIQVGHRDTHARRVLLFTVLDTLESLTGRPIELHCSLEFASRTLNGIKAAIPSQAHEILLPAAERSVSALKRLQQGFFMMDPQGRVPVPGEKQPLDADKAAAQYLKMLRNATHGHGTNKQRQRHLTEALLAHHNGQVPHDIGLLGYLYLLDLLTRPAALRSALSAR